MTDDNQQIQAAPLAGKEPSAVEAVKAASNELRGALAAELADGTDHFSADSTHLVKFHGFYQQDDRDVRRARAAKQLPLLYACMVRAAVPGGVLSAGQWSAMNELAELVADRAPRSSGPAAANLRITTRQGMQFHFVAKNDLRPLIAGLNDKLVTTLAACGDVARNVMACPAPLVERHGVDLFGFAEDMARNVRPKSRAYYELWIDHEQAASVIDPRSEQAGSVESLYGDTYLPRKFKMAFAWPGDNCVDLFSHDLGFVPTFRSADHTAQDLRGVRGVRRRRNGSEPRPPRRHLPPAVHALGVGNRSRCRTVGRSGDRHVPRPRRSQRPGPGPAQVPHRRSRPRLVHRRGQGPPRRNGGGARRGPAGAGVDRRRLPSRLARTARRPLVPWHPRGFGPGGRRARRRRGSTAATARWPCWPPAG